MSRASTELEEDALLEFYQGENPVTPFYKRVIDNRIATLREKMLVALRNHRDREAGEYRAAMEELSNIPKLIKARIDSLRNPQRSIK